MNTKQEEKEPFVVEPHAYGHRRTLLLTREEDGRKKAS